jgi:hypothetical protein
VSDEEKINEALDKHVSADGIDAEEAWHRELAVQAFRCIADRAAAVEERER